MSSLPTDIWQVIVGFCYQKLRFREVCKQLSDELEYVVSLLYLPESPIIDFPENIRVMGLMPSQYTEELQTGINFEHVTYIDLCRNTCFQDKDLLRLPSLLHLNCGWNTNLTDDALIGLTNLISLDCECNMIFANNGLVNFTKSKRSSCKWNIKISNEGISHLKLLEQLVIPSYARINTHYDKDKFPFVDVSDSPYATRKVFKRVW